MLASFRVVFRSWVHFFLAKVWLCPGVALVSLNVINPVLPWSSVLGLSFFRPVVLRSRCPVVQGVLWPSGFLVVLWPLGFGPMDQGSLARIKGQVHR